MSTGKVYIVSSGCYSDYEIRAIFSEKERAESYRSFLNEARFDDVHLETWEVDRPRADLPGSWEIVIDQDGEIRDCRRSESVPPGAPPERRRIRYVQTWKRVRAGELDDDAPRLQKFPVNEFIGWGETQEHARRSAENLRRETVATEGRRDDRLDEYREAQKAEDAAERSAV